MKNVADSLKSAYEASGLSFEDIAKATGIPKATVARYITGQTKKVPIDRLDKIASALGSSAQEVYGLEPKEILSGLESVPMKAMLIQDEFYSKYSKLTQKNKEELMSWMDFMLSQNKK